MKLDVKKLRLRLEEAGFSFYEDTKKSRCYKKNGVAIYVTKNNTAPESYIKLRVGGQVNFRASYY